MNSNSNLVRSIAKARRQVSEGALKSGFEPPLRRSARYPNLLLFGCGNNLETQMRVLGSNLVVYSLHSSRLRYTYGGRPRLTSAVCEKNSRMSFAASFSLEKHAHARSPVGNRTCVGMQPATSSLRGRGFFALVCALVVASVLAAAPTDDDISFKQNSGALCFVAAALCFGS